jgi:hypothetical protein
MPHGYYMNGWDWAWMVPMMLTWIVLLGVAVYAAVRVANSHRPLNSPPRRRDERPRGMATPRRPRRGR